MMLAEAHETDPKGADVIEVKCPECNRDGYDNVVYYDKHGNELSTE